MGCLKRVWMGFVLKTKISLRWRGQFLSLVIAVPSAFSGRPQIFKLEWTYGVRGCRTKRIREVIFTQTIYFFLHKKKSLETWLTAKGKKWKRRIISVLWPGLSRYFHGPHHDNISVSPKDRKTDLNLYVLPWRITASKRRKTVVALLVLLQTTYRRRGRTTLKGYKLIFLFQVIFDTHNIKPSPMWMLV